MDPAIKVCLLVFFNEEKTKGRNIRAAMLNRNPRNNKGEMSLNAFLISAKVPPQIKVLNRSAISPVYFFIKEYLKNANIFT